MKLAQVQSVALTGVAGAMITVEAHLAAGLPGTTVIGSSNSAVVQARDRVKAAVQSSGRTWPDSRITLALSPADLPKRGAGYDLPLAVAVMAASNVVTAESVSGVVVIGELGLDGSVRAVRGILPMLLAARAAGWDRALVPAANLQEAALATGMTVRGVENLRDLIGTLRGEGPGLVVPDEIGLPDMRDGPDLADVLGQPEARRALEIAAAGGHHLLMIGPPGAGKTMLASRLPGLLPLLSDEESLEVTAVHSVAGTLADDTPLIVRPPFVDPHHSASVASMIGGGSGHIRPGSVSLAHRGVLFLDEAAEAQRGMLDALRQPMESGFVLVSRIAGAVRFPARFQLVLAANPCPCAAATDLHCTCAPGLRRRYLSKLSGPLLDRVDIQVTVPPLHPLELVAASEEPRESSTVVAARVLRARLRAVDRWSEKGWRCNAEVPGDELRRWWRPQGRDKNLLHRIADEGRLTGRGYDRVLRLAATCADLGDRERPDSRDLATALALRCGDIG